MEYLNLAWLLCLAHPDYVGAIAYGLVGGLVSAWCYRKRDRGIADYVVLTAVWPVVPVFWLMLLGGWAIWRLVSGVWWLVRRSLGVVGWPFRIFWRGLKYKPGPFDGKEVVSMMLALDDHTQAGLVVTSDGDEGLEVEVKNARIAMPNDGGFGEMQFGFRARRAGEPWTRVKLTDPECDDDGFVGVSDGAEPGQIQGMMNMVCDHQWPLGSAATMDPTDVDNYDDEQHFLLAIGDAIFDQQQSAAAALQTAINEEPEGWQVFCQRMRFAMPGRRLTVDDDADTIEAGEPPSRDALRRPGPTMAVPYGSKPPEPLSADPNKRLLPSGKNWVKIEDSVECRPLPGNRPLIRFGSRDYPGPVEPDRFEIYRKALYLEQPPWVRLEDVRREPVKPKPKIGDFVRWNGNPRWERVDKVGDEYVETDFGSMIKWFAFKNGEAEVAL